MRPLRLRHAALMITNKYHKNEALAQVICVVWAGDRSNVSDAEINCLQAGPCGWQPIGATPAQLIPAVHQPAVCQALNNADGRKAVVKVLNYKPHSVVLKKHTKIASVVLAGEEPVIDTRIVHLVTPS